MRPDVRRVVRSLGVCAPYLFYCKNTVGIAAHSSIAATAGPMPEAHRQPCSAAGHSDDSIVDAIVAENG